MGTKNLLIVCDHFPPQFGPRMGYLSKYLPQFGWETYVVAGENPTRNDFDTLVGFAKEVHVIPYKKHRPWNPLHLLTLVFPFDYLRNERELRRQAEDVIRRNNISCVLACTCGLFPLWAGYHAARKFNLPFVADFRDMAEQSPKTCWRHLRGRAFLYTLWPWLNRITNTAFRNFFIRRADAVTSVSTWHIDLLSKLNSNAHLVYNGYDPEVFSAKTPKTQEQFTIVYTGTLASSSLRDPTLLLQAIQALDREKVIAPDRFQVIFYCGRASKNHSNDIHEQIKELQIESYVQFKDFVPASMIPDILARASVLLVLCNKSTEDGPHGVMTTKLFEYLAVNRPILCVRSDEDCLEKVIQDTHSGVAARTVGETKAFLLEQYQYWCKNGYTIGTTDANAILQFSRKTQAKQFADIFDTLVDNPTVWGSGR